MKAYQDSIELSAALDLDNPSYRDNLATCWGYKGFALGQLGNVASLQTSLQAVDKAIELRAPLDLDNLEYRYRFVTCRADMEVSRSLLAGAARDLETASRAFERAEELFAPLINFPQPFNIESARFQDSEGYFEQLAEQIELDRGALAMVPQLWRDFADDIMAASAAAIRATAAEPDKCTARAYRPGVGARCPWPPGLERCMERE